jgi:hypothetical protein
MISLSNIIYNGNERMLNEGKQIYNFKTVPVRTFVISFHYSSGLVPLRQKVKDPTILVPVTQHWS